MFKRIAKLSIAVLLAAGVSVACASACSAGEATASTAAFTVPATQSGTPDRATPAAATDPCPAGAGGFGWG